MSFKCEGKKNLEGPGMRVVDDEEEMATGEREDVGVVDGVRVDTRDGSGSTQLKPNTKRIRQRKRTLVVRRKVHQHDVEITSVFEGCVQ